MRPGIRTTEFWLLFFCTAAIASFAWTGKYDSNEKALDKMVVIVMSYVTYRTAQKGGGNGEAKGAGKEAPSKEPPSQP